MNKTLIAAICTTLALVACSDKTSENQAASAASAVAGNVCNNPQLINAVKAQAHISFETIRQYSQQSDLYDEVKLLSLFNQFNIQVSDAKMVQDSCQAQVSIDVPDEVFDLAAQNAPLVQQDEPKKIIASNTATGNIHFDGQQLTFPLNYTIEIKGSESSINTKDENLKSAMRLLATSLLPYGIKDTLTYQGKIMSRQDALKLMHTPKSMEIASVPDISHLEEVEPLSNDIPEPPRPEELSASNINGNAPEVLQPTEPVKNSISDSELAQAREANQIADQSIKSAWKKIDPKIQKSLVDEQRNWESKKRQSCRNAGAKGADAAEIQYLQMQCDTRLTRERVQYLNGYSIE